MRVIGIFAVVTLLGMQSLTLAAPLTKWFKTDNSTYYIEPEQKFTWYQAYTECKGKNYNLLSYENFDQDELLHEYLKQTFATIPDFWLNFNADLDLTNIQPSVIQQIFNPSGKDDKIPDVINPEDPNNCVLSKDGTVKGCDIAHGYICFGNDTAGKGVQNIQNIILRFS